MHDSPTPIADPVVLIKLTQNNEVCEVRYNQLVEASSYFRDQPGTNHVVSFPRGIPQQYRTNHLYLL